VSYSNNNEKNVFKNKNVPVPDYAQLLRKSGDTRNWRRTSGTLLDISANNALGVPRK